MSRSEKHCPDCDTIKPMSEYYRAGPYYQRRCKPCHNKTRNKYYHKKGNGFEGLPVEIREALTRDINNNMKKKDVATKYNFTYSRVARWCRQGKFNSTEPV